MRKIVEGIAASFISFTRIPLSWPLKAESFQDATWHIPLVGWLNAGLMVLLWQYLPVAMDLKIFLLMLLPVLLSGGMHEDGLADSSDGIFGGQTLERRLAIMKDPVVGSFGVLGLVLYVLGYYLALKNLPAFSMVSAICIALPLSRLQGPLLAAILPYVRGNGQDSRAKAYLGSDRKKILWSFFWVLPVVFFVPTWPFGFYLASSFLLVSLGLGWIFHRKLGGITGDCLGAAIKVTELLLLWTFASQFNP